VRGEGAVLRNAKGERFMPAVHEDAELAPRDVVARAVEQEHERTGQVVLDVSSFDFAGTFPDLAALCAEHGVDPSAGIPVVPAEHFLCGGVDVDTRGRASLDRLYAVGECARTGVHGANRLASTSLLEGLVWGLRAGRDAAGHPPTDRDVSVAMPTGASPSGEKLDALFERLQRTMDEHVALRRTPDGLGRALSVLQDLEAEAESLAGVESPRAVHEVRSAATVAVLIAEAAAANDTSVGCHFVTGASGTTGDAASVAR
jgi:L-aspartate oxidase